MGGTWGLWWIVPFLPTLGPEFLSSEPRPNVHPHGVFISPSAPACLAYSGSHIVWAFHLRVSEQVLEKTWEAAEMAVVCIGRGQDRVK